MARILIVILALMPLTPGSIGQEIPEQLRGEWVVSRIIPTRAISCWGQQEADQLLGTEVEYKSDSFRWKDVVTAHPTVSTKTMSADQFESEYSGGGAADSRVTFRELGVQAKQATIVELGHPRANITGATIEIPGDWALVKSINSIIISVCNVYFEAHRKQTPASLTK
jgi:hypothetical protein